MNRRGFFRENRAGDGFQDFRGFGFLHDGSVDTLEALIDKNNDRMGRTAKLSPEERRALVAYLKTL